MALRVGSVRTSFVSSSSSLIIGRWVGPGENAGSTGGWLVKLSLPQHASEASHGEALVVEMSWWPFKRGDDISDLPVPRPSLRTLMHKHAQVCQRRCSGKKFLNVVGNTSYVYIRLFVALPKSRWSSANAKIVRGICWTYLNFRFRPSAVRPTGSSPVGSMGKAHHPDVTYLDQCIGGRLDGCLSGKVAATRNPRITLKML